MKLLKLIKKKVEKNRTRLVWGTKDVVVEKTQRFSNKIRVKRTYVYTFSTNYRKKKKYYRDFSKRANGKRGEKLMTWKAIELEENNAEKLSAVNRRS